MSTQTVDYPLLRAATECPLCRSRKRPGELACWQCQAIYGLSVGNPWASMRFAAVEAVLTRLEVKPIAT